MITMNRMIKYFSIPLFFNTISLIIRLLAFHLEIPTYYRMIPTTLSTNFKGKRKISLFKD